MKPGALLMVTWSMRNLMRSRFSEQVVAECYPLNGLLRLGKAFSGESLYVEPIGGYGGYMGVPLELVVEMRKRFLEVVADE